MTMKLALIGLTALSILTVDAMTQRGGFGAGDMTEVWEHLAAQYDKDKDGKITQEEYPRGEAKFANWDSNGDGTITKTDLENRRGRGRNRGGRRQGGNRGGNQGRDPRAAGANLVLGRRVAKHADQDKDSKVTGKEWAAFLAAVDCNEDGLASAEELKLSNRRFRMVKTAVDANKDGDVQVQELGAVFAKLDRNKNKELSAQEIGINRPANRGANRDRGGRGGNQAAVPQPGQVAPDFDLPLAEQPKDAQQKVTIKLSSFAGKKPVALIFGSYT